MIKTYRGQKVKVTGKTFEIEVLENIKARAEEVSKAVGKGTLESPVVLNWGLFIENKIKELKNG